MLSAIIMAGQQERRLPEGRQLPALPQRSPLSARKEVGGGEAHGPVGDAVTPIGAAGGQYGPVSAGGPGVDAAAFLGDDSAVGGVAASNEEEQAVAVAAATDWSGSTVVRMFIRVRLRARGW